MPTGAADDFPRAVTGAPIPVEYVPAKAGEMPAATLDIATARALGYRPAHDLKSGLATVWQEFTTQPPRKEKQHSEQS